jgi:hypothetical protein
VARGILLMAAALTVAGAAVGAIHGIALVIIFDHRIEPAPSV